MEIALILVAAAALAVIFFLKGKKKTSMPDAHADSALPRGDGHGTAQPRQGEARAPRPARPTTQAESPQARRQADSVADVEGAALAPGAAEDESSTGPHSFSDSSDVVGDAPAPTTSFEETSLDEEPRDEFVSIAPERADDSPPPLVRSPAPPDTTKSANLLSLRKGLQRSRSSEGFFGKLKALLGGRKELSSDIADEIEEILLTSDVGLSTTEKILERLKAGMSRGDLNDEAKVFKALREEAHKTLAVDGTAGALIPSARPTVVLFVGVNGAGKTTTIGKLAQKFTSEGKKVMLSAGDTYRAAAVDQLQAWGERAGVDVITGKEGADPSSVLFDAISAAKAAGADVLLADTAGRLHTKTNLMQEMTKIQKVASKALDGAPHETFLVIDATNGQNALAQAREFKEALPLTGLVLTKLDGTAKGGVVLGICDDLKVPVRYVGVGERAEDLHAFEPAAFVEALLGAENEVVAA